MNARLLLALAAAFVSSADVTANPVVIAHRGASGYLPEHTLEAAAFAHALGADFIEQDVVMSKDDVLVVCHDIHIDTTTDVATRFPARARGDGRFYAIDFMWEELRSLTVRERFDPSSGRAVFPGRFPVNGASFRLCSLEESILLVQGLNRSTGREAGIYPEIKAPAWHGREGKDLGRALLEVLARHGYTRATDNVYVQCFEPTELKRLRTELNTSLKLIQLIDDETSDEPGIDTSAMRTLAGLKEIAAYAQGIGPHLSQVVDFGRTGGGGDASDLGGDGLRLTALVADAHASGLLVHPYTFRSDALPRGVSDMDALLELFFEQAKIDGVFIDQPDVAVRFLKRRSEAR
jgi:glycerophosphoryl diester phosphodiesterase